MDQAAEDKAVAAVWLRIEDLALGGGKINELRAAVGRLRKAGKPVYAELTSADTGPVPAGRGLRRGRSCRPPAC